MDFAPSVKRAGCGASPFFFHEAFKCDKEAREKAKFAGGIFFLRMDSYPAQNVYKILQS